MIYSFLSPDVSVYSLCFIHALPSFEWNYHYYIRVTYKQVTDVVNVYYCILLFSSFFCSVADVPRSLNSDISYFGVGGKQAIFFIGDATRVRDYVHCIHLAIDLLINIIRVPNLKNPLECKFSYRLYCLAFFLFYQKKVDIKI